MTRDPMPTGEMTLVDYFYEPSSSHYEKSRTVTLVVGDGRSVPLLEEFDECDQFGGPRSESSHIWSIDRVRLIDFVKSNGSLIK